MATYIALLKFTQQGVENIKGGPTRLDQAKKLFSSMGAEMKAFYLVMGQIDCHRDHKSILKMPDRDQPRFEMLFVHYFH